MSTSTALVFDDAAFSYGRNYARRGVPNRPALSGVNGRVDSGEALALIGPNGAGKSTLLKGILGAVPLVAGALTLPGQSCGHKGSIGYVPQVMDLDPTFPVTVSQVVGMGLYGKRGWMRRLSGKDKKRIRTALERVGMQDQHDRHFGTLSGGQRQRVLLARAIVSDPAMILLDEPFNGLDQPNRAALIEIIQWVKTQGVIVVVSTHDVDLAWQTCDKVALLAGRQIAFGAIAQVLTQPLLDQTFGRVAHVD